MKVVINETQLSDLFFNYDLENLNSAYAEQDELGTDENSIQEALKKDAEAFSELLNGQVPPEWLIDDYNKRS